MITVAALLLPALAWGQVILERFDDAPLSHSRLTGGWTVDPNSRTTRISLSIVSDPQPLGFKVRVGQPDASRPRQAAALAPDSHGRWFVFAAAAGRSVGLNVTPTTRGPIGANWVSDAPGSLISGGQAGVGWSQGRAEAAFGYVHRDISANAFDPYRSNARNISDSMVGLSLSIHSR